MNFILILTTESTTIDAIAKNYFDCYYLFEREDCNL